MSASAPFIIDDSAVPALRNVVSRIARVGYGETQISERLGLADLNDLEWRALPIYQALLSQRDALAVAIDLLLLQGTIPPQELDALFTPDDIAVLMQTGLLAVNEQGLINARASLFPVGDSLIFAEHAWPMLPHPGLAYMPRNHVMAIGADSRWLARVTVRRAVDQALDLCTGSGIQALLAARHARQVLAIDINPRAARCTRFNALASGINNVVTVVGDLFTPLGNERFDLITANPPFVPSPVDAVQFRDGGRTGEDIQRRIIAGLPHHLAPGGIAQMVTELGEHDGATLPQRLSTWLGGAPCDIHILRLREYSIASYALGHAVGEDYATFLHSVRAWHQNLNTQGYTRIVAVLLAVQWSDTRIGSPWIRSEAAEPPRDYDAGIAITNIFAAERCVRQPHLHKIIAQSRMQRAEKIKLFEIGMMGDEVNIRTNAQLLDNSLAVHQWLNPIEREILVRMDNALTLPEIFACTANLKLEQEIIFATLSSLMQRRLISYCPVA